MADLPNQGTLFAPLTAHDIQKARDSVHGEGSRTLTAPERALAAEALSYTLAQLSRGCPYAPEWSDADIVERAGPLLGRLRC